jgi:hypothetical protein
MAVETPKTERGAGAVTRLVGRGILAAIAITTAAFALACGVEDVGAPTGGSTTGSGTPTTPASPTGAVSLFFTDAPSPVFDEILLTVKSVELLGGDGPVVLYDGQATFDLLRLRYVSELFSIKYDVPSGTYSKIRLILDDVELVWRDDKGKVKTDHPKLTGKGKLDLVPRGTLDVTEGGMVVVQVDVDAEKAIHIKKKGKKEEYQFRPVVFVDVVNAFSEDRLARLHGVIEEIDASRRSLLVCDLGSSITPHQGILSGPTPPGGATPLGDDDDDDGDDDDDDDDDDDRDRGECVDIVVLPDAALYDESANGISFGNLRRGDSLLAVGHLRTDREDLQMLARVLVQGDPGSFALFSGVVSSGPDASGIFEVDTMLPGSDRTETVAVELTNASLILSRGGAELGPAWLFVGQSVEVVGSPLVGPSNGRQLRAAVVWADYAPTDPGPGPDPEPEPGVPTDLSGIISSVDSGAREIVLTSDEGEACVSVDDNTEIDLYTCTSNGCSGRQVGFGALAAGQQVVASGRRFNGNDCLIAEDLAAFAVSP